MEVCIKIRTTGKEKAELETTFFFSSKVCCYNDYKYNVYNKEYFQMLSLRVIPCEITHSKNESLFTLSTQSVHPMTVHNPEYQPPVTSGSRVTGCANFVN